MIRHGERTLWRALAISALAALFCLLCSVNTWAASDPSKYGIEEVSAALSSTQAGAHSDFTTTIELKTDPAGPTQAGLNPPYARTRNLSVTLPPGLLGNPDNFPKCTLGQLEDRKCPFDSQIGITEVSVYLLSTLTEPVYLMEPPAKGDVVARIGFQAGVYPTVLNVRVRPEIGYGIEAKLEGANASAQLVRAVTTLWGVPSSPIHDEERLTPDEAEVGGGPPGGRESGLEPLPFITNPTRCGVKREISVSSDSYQTPGVYSTKTATLPAITGCGKLTFAPTFSLTPGADTADSPSGMDAKLFLSQEGLRDPDILATPHLKKATVVLPEGMTMNPAAASGLGACTEAQIGLISEDPIRFNALPPSCPSSAKVGTAQIKTPVLPEPLEGGLYLASQSDNPFDTLLAGYLVAEGQGVMIKLAGRFDVNPLTGQIAAVFDDNPEQPVEEVELHFKDGPQGVLTTPLSCGSYGIQSSLSPWSAADPSAPKPTEVVTSTSPFSIVSGPGGSPCPDGGFSVGLTAGTTDPSAGKFSPFVMRLTREDGTPRLQGLELTLPLGLTGKLAGIPYCPESALQLAVSLDQPGQGASELASPSCPEASLLGTVTAGAGSGPSPFFVSTGKAFLAGPYKGAPLSFAIVAPAVAGPFDLGNVVVRTALYVDPQSAQITAVSDPVSTVLDGIPLDLRDVRVNLDRSGFTLNPTSCSQKSFTGVAIAESGARAPISERFQAASCASLGFKPKLSIKLSGGMKRTDHPALTAVLTARKGDANLRSTAVTLPHSEFIDHSHIGNPCTRAQFNVDACPKKSVLGTARVFTPLLDNPLEGPIYFRSNGGERLLPDVVLDLGGQIPLIQIGEVDSVNPKSARIRTTFRGVPDAPVRKVVLKLKGGKEGLLVNSANLCSHTRRADVRMAAHNGLSRNFKSVVKTSCSKGTKRGRR